MSETPQAGHTLPRWEELPDFDLYMDQVISLMERYLGSASNADGKGLTPSMVNNYVKIGVVPAPAKKRYTRIHLACLIVVCALKPVLPLATIQNLLSRKHETADMQEFYDRFCAQFELAQHDADTSSHGESEEALMNAALHAQAHRAAALALDRKINAQEQQAEGLTRARA